MGTEAIWIPLVMAAVGAGASVYNTKQTAKKSDNALAAQIESGARKGKEADNRTRQLIDQTAAGDPANERATALGQYVNALKAGNGSATAGLIAPKGAVSGRFAADAASAAKGISEYGNQQAGLFSTIDSAKRQRDNEGFARDRAATDINAISRRARAADFLLGLKTASAGIRNPFIDAGSSFLTSAAGSYGGGGAGGTSAFANNANAAQQANMAGSLFNY